MVFFLSEKLAQLSIRADSKAQNALTLRKFAEYLPRQPDGQSMQDLRKPFWEIPFQMPKKQGTKRNQPWPI